MQRAPLGLLLLASSAVACGCGSKSFGFTGDGSGDGSSAGAPGDGSVSFGDASAGEGGFTGDPMTCAQAAAARSYVGCDYWPTSVANAVWSMFDFAVVVANTLPTAAGITVTGPNGFDEQVTVPPNQLTKVYLPWVPELKGPDADNCGNANDFVNSVTATAGAYHLVSSQPVTVYQFNTLEYKGTGGPPAKDWSQCPGNQSCQYTGTAVGCYSFSSDASLLLPSTAMTGNYRILGIHSSGTRLGGYFAVTGTQDGTGVTVTLSTTSQVNPGGDIPAAGPGATINFSLNAGDVAEVVGDGTTLTADLSGSLLKATKPVQVIGGISCIPIPDGFQYSCDHVEESVFPAETLGKHYVVTVPTGPNGTPVGHLVRLYGNFDDTHLTYSPAMPSGCPTTLAAGQVAECGVLSSDFVVQGDQAFAVGSVMLSAAVVDANHTPPNQKGDPSMSFSTAVEQYRTKYIFLAPSDYDVNYADVVAPPGTVLTLDGTPVTTAPMAVDGNFGVVRVPLTIGATDGAHVITATNPVGIQVLGYGSYTSYQYPGGLELATITQPPPK